MSNFIKDIEISNFKSIRHQKIEGCKRINVFIGYPNVGKSNILEALGLFSLFQLGNGEHFKFDSIVRIKHFSELYFNHNYKNGFHLKLNNVQLDFNNGNHQSILKGSISVDNEKQGDLGFEINPEFHIAPLLSLKNGWPFDFAIKKYDFLNNASVHLVNSNSLSIPNGINLLDVLQNESELRKSLSEILKQYDLQLLLDRITNEIFFIKTMNGDSLLRIPYHQVADTIKRLIFYKAAIQTNKDTVLIFEEPEAHMFPPYIRKFTSDVVFDKTNQFFIATHSPYVLDEFIEEAPDDLAIYLVDYKNGETIIKNLSKENLEEIREFGVDLFFNLESYLKNG